MKPETFKSALTVNEGIEQPPCVNEDSVRHFQSRKRKKLSVDDYVKGILEGNRTILSQAITMVESSLASHQEIAQAVIEKCLPYSGKSIRIGITGVPGVGKSLFIETFGVAITSQGKKLAVLAIDPSSERTKGSILGDKTRMEQLSVDPNAFIRPSPSAGSLGGVARKTRESIILCEAAGFDTIFIETVGVGQSETAVHSMVDFFLLLMLAGAGDELQGIKRGIMEMADGMVITKADGENQIKANEAKVQYQSALHLFPLGDSDWEPQVLTCSAHKNIGIEPIWEMIENYYKHTKANRYFESKRASQAKYWMYETINEQLKNNFYHNPVLINEILKAENEVLTNKISSFEAAGKLLNHYFKKGF
jgi:LAO/AO transport system kinase